MLTKPSQCRDESDMTDLERVKAFFEFLQGNAPDGVYLAKGHQPKMSRKKAWATVWFLQEYLSVFPSNIELCYNCGSLYDNHEEGLYWESKGRFYCDQCLHLVPENYDRGKR